MDSKCRITATNKKIQSSVNTYMVVADIRNNTKGTWKIVPVDADTCLIQSNNDIYTPTLFTLASTAALTINGIENVKFQSEGGKPCITVYKQDGSLRNAASDITTLLTKFRFRMVIKLFSRKVLLLFLRNLSWINLLR